MNQIMTTECKEVQKLTATQIEKECPERLRQIAKEIKERLSKANKQAQQAQDHLIAVDELLAQAKSLCDDDGFKKFRELFCPQLSKFQAYALLAIASGKKTLADHRADERDRKRKMRARQKAGAKNSGTVPENQHSAPESGDMTAEASEETTDASLVQGREPVKSRGAISPRDDALLDFSAVVVELIRRTKKQEVDRFVAVSVPVDDLAALGKYLSDLATFIKSRHGKARLTEKVQGIDNVSTDRSPDATKTEVAALNATDSQAA